MQTSLFTLDDAIGPALRENMLSEQEERELLLEFEKVDLPPFMFQGWPSNRRTATFGWQYDFSASTFTPVKPIPDFLEPLKSRAAAFAQLDESTLVQAVIIRYDPGAGIGWHKDRPEFGDVIGFSLGASASMRFRRRREGGFDRFSVPLPARSAYHLAGEIRTDWEHSIAPMDETRWSVTIRNLSAKGLEKGL